MLLKWLRKKLLHGIIEDIISELPEPALLRDKMLKIVNDYKDELLQKLWNAIKQFVVNFVNEKLGKK